MAEALLAIRFAGPHVTLQDGGRPGWMRYGVPRSGAMDRLALQAANLALGNPARATVIEISRGGLQLSCSAGCVSFALAGGGFHTGLDGKPGAAWQRGQLREGQRLVIRPGLWGSWCYLAFAGEIVQPDWLGSTATHGPSGLGGRRLASGDQLQLRETRIRADLPQDFPCPVFARPRAALQITPGPQERFFAPGALDLLEQGGWQVSPASDRMGIRLQGPELKPLRLDMPSEPLLRGALQIAGDGVATVLMADHQTTGGYPKLATVLDCELDGFAQCRPGTPLSFRRVTAEAAIALARTRAAIQADWLGALARRSQG
ncbi:biotin-dependent carboxyltransferase family protein [Pseudogemmobacter faecipullorum]|uniref:Biotin-dependent carboxyltransferase n=1 Tax=Pseudogemmobacter faecipullorum TaxID=2755041 RepID=A0ABS8CJG2_9RHOB|nr:biotin-dependent carboxyltransferase family protein [Pseudogemmobacter faecipullorum]MCB5409539.1 biotin-dependent carboxyltransferase [Pseudogemmobacter faecipullorum]